MFAAEDDHRHYHQSDLTVRPLNNRTIAKPLRSIEGWVLFVSNVHEETSEEDIREVFAEYGNVLNVALNLDRRTGFVEYQRFEDAASARDGLNDTELLGMSIKVDWCVMDKSDA